MQLLPIQREFLAADGGSYNRNSQAVLLTAPAGLDLPQVVEELYRRHDALSLRFVFVDGLWQAVQAPFTAATIAESCVLETLPEDPNSHAKFIRDRCAHYLHSLDITNGPLFHAVYLQGHAEKQGRLFLLIHQLVVDEVSWRVLLRDLDAAYRQAPTQRTTKNSSYQQWAEALADYATSDTLQRERNYWHDQCAKNVEPWPISPISKEPASYASVRSVPVQLSVAETTSLLNDCTAAYHTEINELLLCAVYLAMRRWSGETPVRLTMEDHGRENLFPELDITETVGCFTTRYPLLLHSEAPDFSATIKSVKEQYRAVPHHGIGYGLLRYVAGDEVFSDSQVLFRYQGELNQVMHSVDPHRPRQHALCVSGSVAQGALRFKLEYSEKQYRKETIVELAGRLEEALRALIAHAQGEEAGYYTTSDFPLATVNQEMLDEWQTTYAIEQLYPATAMQKGMFFHSLLDRGAYVTQLYSTIEGELQLPLLKQAWHTVIERHAMLRTIFVGEGEEQHQLVTRQVSVLPWYAEDLRELSAEEQTARFEEYRQADRAKGFDRTQAPLMRLSLFRLDDDQYRLLWSHHHSLLDGWSIRLVFSEVLQVYAALSEGLKPVLPPVAEYARYIEWLLAQDKDEAYRYWQTYLANVDTVTRLPYDTQARQQKPIHQVQEVSLGASEMVQLKALAKKHHITVNTLLQFAWGLVLQRYAGEREVVFGAVSSGRLAEVAEVERMVGLCISSIPVVVSVAGNESLADATKRLHSTFQQSQKYGYLPLTEIQKQSRLRRETPLFESLLVFENYTLDLTSAGANGVGPVRIGEFGANLQDTFPVTLSLAQDESLQVTCKYFADRLSAPTISRMLDHFLRVLQQLPSCETVSGISLLTEEETAHVQAASQGPRVEYAGGTCIHEQFERQAALTPDAVALVFDEHQLSYRELNSRANQLAHYLQSLGVGPERVVGICLERSLEMVVALLGVLKADAAYLPLDPDYPPERLSFMLADAAVPVLLTTTHLQARLAMETAAVICLDTEWESIAAQSSENPASAVSGDNLAYVIYTSGSTGQPKGAMNTHAAIYNRLCWMQGAYGLTAADRILQKTPFSFDVSVWEFFWPLLTGACLVVARPGGHRDSAYLVELIQQEQITTLHFVPAMLQVFLAEEGVEACRSLRRVICSGEALARELQDRFFTRLPDVELHNLYGPTEAAVDVTYWACDASSPHSTVPIGRPIANTQIYLVDQHNQLAPMGVAGELCIGGVQLARGYHQRAALTAERFVPDPFSSVPGARLYRTGDLARYLSDGSIEYLGRLDFQVKLRGFRIELGEIEAALAAHPAVSEAVVLAVEDLRDEKQLVAYLLLESDERPTNEELRAALKAHLPEYMVPAQFVMLKEFPLTPNGKVDRKALAALERPGAGTEVVYVAPRTAEEELLAGIWAEVLGVERVGVHDSFFARGGHSLLATQVVSRVKVLFGVELPLRAMFDTATLAEMAQLIVTERQAGGVRTGPAIERRSRETAPALSYAQQRLWFLDQFEPQSAVYNVPAAIKLTGELDRAALAQSLSEIARRHEVLRTSFPSVNGRPVQLIAPPAPIDLPLTDLQALTEQDRKILGGRYSAEQKVTHEFTFSGLVKVGRWGDVTAQQLATEETARPFDLAHGPVWRVRLLRLSEQEHVLLLTMHHIVTDGWSIGVLLQELTTLYEVYRRAEVSPLAELPVQYADFAEWQREWLRGAVLEEQMGYWREQLAGSSGVLELPTDHPRPPVQRYRGASLTVQLSEELTSGLRELSRGEGVTLFMTLLSSWQTLLARYSGQWDLNVGTPIANRTRGEVEGLIGFFINTLVLRTQLKPEASFREQLQQVREVCLGAYAHQDVPFEMVVEELQPERDLSRTPLFQVMFILQNAPLGEIETPAGLKLEPLAVELDTTKFDLTLGLMERDTRLVAWCNYRTDLFEEATIARMLDHWQVLLEAAVADPEQSLSALPLLTAAERAEVVTWNETSTEYARETCIHEQFERQAALTPDAVALVFEDRQLSYWELNSRANQLAHYLQSLGVGPDTIVGICLERSLEMVVALLGVLKAGAAYLPLDPDYPPERLSFMLADAAVPVLLTTTHLQTRLAMETAAVICLDTEWESIAAQSSENPASAVSGDNLAYVIYTSGSTGQPKGAMNKHAAIYNRLCWMQEAYGLTAADRILQKTPFSFDVSVWEFFWPLMTGACLVVARPGGHRDSAYLVELIQEEQITTLHFVPAMLQVFLAEEGVEACRSLRRVICSGEALARELQDRFFTRLPEVELHNLYGPTEAAVDVTYWACDASSPHSNVPIGRPIANTKIYLVDQHNQLAPVGVAGELCIGGVQLARGYHQRAALTAERFVPDPFSSVPGARLYRTGDLARYLSDGSIEYLGRLDFQVKLRGFRIELGEIEAALAAHPAVREAVAIVREEKSGDKQLLAYVVGQAAVSELQGYLKEKLPPYMAPQLMVKLDQLPLTPNGKVDRKALAALERPGAAAEVIYVAPRTAEEELLAGIWAEVLGAERVGAHDSFFARGGHSLLATQVVSRVKALFGVELPLRAMFDTATLAELAQLIVTERQAGGVRTGPAIERRSRETAPALSYAQQRLWFLDQLAPQSAVYNVPAAIKLTGELDRAALSQSLSEIVRRHEVLRTSYPNVGGQPIQLIASPAPVDLPLIDLQAEENKVAVVRELAAEEAARPFDLAHGPMWRVQLLQLSEQEHVLLLTMHHIVTDGWSIGVLVRELTTLYESYRRAEASPLVELPVQYADFAEWQREWLHGAVLEEQMGYWREQLAGSSGMLELPTDHPRPPVQNHHGASRTIQLSEELTRGLRELSRREGVTLFMTLLSSWQTLLAHYSGQSDVNVGTPIANRTRGEVEGLIGFFVNTLVLRTRIDAAMSFREQLQQVREVCLEAYAHQDVPFEMVVEELQPERDTSRSPLFQVMFVMQNAPQGELEMPAGLKLEPLEVEQETTKFELTLMVMETEAGLVGRCSYRTELFEETTIAKMLEHWQVLLEAAVADPEARVMALPYLTEREQHMLLEGWNETRRDYPRDDCVHELFERQAALTPEAFAVVFEGERLSYVELNLRAERLARRLRALGVGPETFVGLLTERTPRMLIGLLAILKAGGAYVPLEPSWPKERLALMLADACTPVLLTEERFANALPDCNARVVLLDAVEEDRDVLIEDLNAPHARPKNPAYVIYTSGSTGTPKGVVVEHRQIVNYVRAVAERVRLEPGMSYAMVQPLTVDSSQSVIFPTFFVGGTIHLISRERATHPVALAEYFDREPVDCLKIAPSHLAALQTATRPERLMPRRRLLIGGEGSRREWAEGLARLAPDCAVFNHYGPTEATVGMLTYRVHANEELGPTHFLPTGLPLANTKAYVLDRYMRPVAVGVSGELYIGGDCVARGYLNRPGTTAEKFVPDPYSSEPGARLYKTGDVVRRLADGNILFIGRDDHQVKIRGFRIELGEIEAALTRHVRVGRAVVIAREEARGDRRLVGYVVPSEPGENEGLREELREDLRKKLPDYMVPSALVVLDSLPLSAHGKLDVRRLPAPDAALVQPEGYVAPRTPEEELLAGIWGEVLGTERISVQDNFFERGGHSLLATQVISRVQALFGIDLPLRAMFETATLAELAQLIVDQRQAEGFIETENLLAELEALSEEEAQSLVAGYGAQL